MVVPTLGLTCQCFQPRKSLCCAQPHRLQYDFHAESTRRRGHCRATDDLEFSQLLFAGPSESLRNIGRARSASDAGVLRRKGRLKEQDMLIDFMVSMHQTHSCTEVMAKLESWIKVRPLLTWSATPDCTRVVPWCSVLTMSLVCACSCVADHCRLSQEHRQDADRSKLKRLVPSIGQMFTDLPLVAAFKEYDRHFTLSRRRFVPPNFAEIRHILNIAQYAFFDAYRPGYR
jgi:IMP-specific 5'-nucleotidase